MIQKFRRRMICILKIINLNLAYLNLICLNLMCLIYINMHIHTCQFHVAVFPMERLSLVFSCWIFENAPRRWSLLEAAAATDNLPLPRGEMMPMHGPTFPLHLERMNRNQWNSILLYVLFLKFYNFVKLLFPREFLDPIYQVVTERSSSEQSVRFSSGALLCLGVFL